MTRKRGDSHDSSVLVTVLVLTHHLSKHKFQGENGAETQTRYARTVRVPAFTAGCPPVQSTVDFFLTGLLLVTYS